MTSLKMRDNSEDPDLMNTKQIQLERISSSLSETQFEPQKMNKLQSLQMIQNDMSPSMMRMDCLDEA